MLYEITRNTLDQTVQIFDAFYRQDITIGANEYNQVYAYFKEVCDTKEIAENFTYVLFKMAQDNGISVITLLEELQSKSVSKIELNQVMAFYFNSFKSKSSLYGVLGAVEPNLPVARNVVI
jgi:hypothetical protein